MNPGANNRIVVAPVADRTDLDDFIRFPRKIYADDRFWVPTIEPQVRDQLDADRNPLFKQGERQLFLAKSGEQVVGTIAAIIDNSAAPSPGGAVGFFGFFETVEDPAVVEGLLHAVRGWMLDRGAVRLRGPLNGSPNDPSGVLIEGRNSWPSVWQGHTPRYYGTLLESIGFTQYDDLVAFEATYDQIGRDLANLPASLQRVAARAQARDDVIIRHLDTDHWDRDISIAHQVYVESHATIFGHRGMDAAVFADTARSLRRFMDPELALLVEVSGQPAGFAVTIPDLNEALRYTSGKLHRRDMLKLAWYRRRIRTASVKLLGVRPGYRRQGLDALLIHETLHRAIDKGYERFEMSLVSDHNPAMGRVLTRFGATPYRRYRVYEREL